MASSFNQVLEETEAKTWPGRPFPGQTALHTKALPQLPFHVFPGVTAGLSSLPSPTVHALPQCL